MLDSLIKFKQAGGGCIVENSGKGWHRKSGYLLELSKKTGVHIVAGTGFYVESSHDNQAIENSSVESISKYMTDEIIFGCHDDNSVKCGFIGEVGISDDMKGIIKSS